MGQHSEIIRAYIETFGPLPDFRTMTDEAIQAVPDKCKEALDRGLPMSDEEWGVATDIPDDATI